MMRIAGVVAALALAAPAAVRAEPAKPAEPAPTCKRVVVGHRQGERQVICEIDTPVIVHGKRLRPGVAIIGKDGREIVGRPRTGDRLSGLSQRLR
jgi:hypothetical protein